LVSLAGVGRFWARGGSLTVGTTVIKLNIGICNRSKYVMIEANIILALVITLTVMGALWLSAFLTKRAMHQVIETFCRHNALSFGQAKTIDELGLTPPDFLQRITHLRDYKPQVLKFLIQKGVVNVTRDGKLYLVEKQFEESLRCRTNDLLPSDRRS
jgi:hypothetical protein